MGIPQVGCQCAVCTSQERKNKRLRPSILVTIDGKRLLVDTTPDFRFQALLHKLDHIDGVLYTHSHYDHVSGLDELRTYYLKTHQKTPVLLSETTLSELKVRYAYLFREKSWGTSLAAQLEFHLLEEKRGATHFLGIPIGYMTYHQGGMEVTGYRFASFAYITDIQRYPDSIFDDLKGVETLVISALRHDSSPVHLTVDEAIVFSQKVGAKTTFFTHMGHELEHIKTNKELPSGFELAYDGMKGEFTI